MKIIRYKDSEVQERMDGRTVRKLISKELGMDFSDIQFLYVTHPREFREKLHSHERSYEIFYFLDPAKYSINGQHYEINKNDLVLLEPGEIHGAIPINNEVRIFVTQVPTISNDKKIYG